MFDVQDGGDGRGCQERSSGRGNVAPREPPGGLHRGGDGHGWKARTPRGAGCHDAAAHVKVVVFCVVLCSVGSCFVRAGLLIWFSAVPNLGQVSTPPEGGTD